MLQAALRLFGLAGEPQPVFAAKPNDHERSHHWPTFRAHWLRDHGECAACGTKEHLQVHHVFPFHLHPDLELDPGNVITLCEGPSRICHFALGHLYDWHRFNPHVREDVRRFRSRVEESRAA